jgi:hypothetical protein
MDPDQGTVWTKKHQKTASPLDMDLYTHGKPTGYPHFVATKRSINMIVSVGKKVARIASKVLKFKLKNFL